jgi:hypothetical protein
LLALGFLGLAHALIDTTIGKARHRDRALATGIRQVRVLAGVAVVCLLGLTAAAIWLPGSAIAHALSQGIG